MSRLLAVTVLVAATVGCATAKPSAPIADFPGREALARIAAAPSAGPRVEVGQVPAEGWTVDAPAGGWPAASAPWQPQGAVAVALAQELRTTGKRLRPTEALACAARELGRYVIAQSSPLPMDLRSFILGACGAMATDVSTEWLSGDIPAAMPEEAIAAQWGSQFRSGLVAKLPADADLDVGFALTRQGDRALAMMAYARMPADLDALVPSAGPDGSLTVSGKIRGEVAHIAGYVNQGQVSVASCFVDPTVQRPRFRVTCQVSPEDETAWIELVYAEPRRVLAQVFARLLVRKSDARQVRYQKRSSSGGEATATGTATAEQFTAAVVRALNEIRAGASLPPVKLHAGQSAVASRVARQYFAPPSEQQPPPVNGLDTHDTIALGLLAGWELGGMIRDGNFVATLVPQTRDPLRWLHDTLEMPIGRYALMQEDIEEIALGPVLLDQPAAVGALVLGYRFHKGNDHRADIRRLFMRALLARRQRKLDAPKRLGGLDELVREELAEVHAGKSTPMKALENVLQTGVDRFAKDMRGYVVETTSLDALEIPEEVLTQPTLHLEIGVTHHKPPGAAWAQLVIIVIFVDYGDAVRT